MFWSMCIAGIKQCCVDCNGHRDVRRVFISLSMSKDPVMKHNETFEGSLASYKHTNARSLSSIMNVLYEEHAFEALV